MWFDGIEPLRESATAESRRWFLPKLQPYSTAAVSHYYSKIQNVLLSHSRKIQMLLENNVRYVHTGEKSTNTNVSCVSKETAVMLWLATQLNFNTANCFSKN